MKNKEIFVILILLGVFLISSPSVNAFEIVPPYLNFTCNVGDTCALPIIVNNLYSYDLWNVSIAPSNYFTFKNIEVVRVNSSNITLMNFSTPSLMNNTNLTVLFQFYKKENITLQPNASTIYIDDNSYIPNYLAIVQGSTITWYNNDSIIHNVKDDGNEFNRDIMPGDSFTYTFSSIKNYTYRDRFFGFTGQVWVKSPYQEVLVHYPNLDINKTFQVTAQYNQGNYTLTLLTSNITMDYNGTKEGVFLFRNTGTSALYNVHFTGDWFGFAQNYFNLGAGQDKYITFTISPIVYSTEGTNMTYNKTISVYTDNGGNSGLSVPIFINYAIVNNMNQSNSERAFIEWLCGTNSTAGAHPDSFLCNGTQIIYVNRTIYEPPPLWVNYSAQDIANIKNTSAEAYTLVTRFASSQQERDDRIESLQQNFSNSVANMSANQQETKDRTDNIFILVILVIAFILFTAMIVGGLWVLKKEKSKKTLDYQNRY